MRFIISLLFSALAAPMAIVQAAPPPAAQARFLAKHQDWLVYMQDNATDKVCFAASAPKDTEPKTAKRGQIFFYLSTWAKDGVRNEVSSLLGYTAKPDSAPSVVVGADTFQLYPNGEKVFMRDPAEERKLLAALQKGETMQIKAQSARGTATTDSYSLSGFVQAVAEIDKACP